MYCKIKHTGYSEYSHIKLEYLPAFYRVYSGGSDNVYVIICPIYGPTSSERLIEKLKITIITEQEFVDLCEETKEFVIKRGNDYILNQKIDILNIPEVDNYTNYNYIQHGLSIANASNMFRRVVATKGAKIVPHIYDAGEHGQILYMQDCCDFSKVNDLNINLFLSTAILRIYKYNIYSAYKWLEFIKKLDIGFDYDMKVVSNIVPNTPLRQATIDIARTGNLKLLKLSSYGLCPTFNSEYVSIFYKNRSVDSRWMSFLRLTLIRYMQHERHCFIPGLAMQIKDHYQDTISYWDALLLAHMGADSRIYSSQDGFNQLLGFLSSDETNVDILTKKYTGKLVSSALANSESPKLNNVFTYTHVGSSEIKKLKKILLDKNFPLLTPYFNQI
jgi:hypothetical protein